MEVPGLRSRKEHIRVIARFRPLDKKERKSKDKICCTVTGSTIKIEKNNGNKTYKYTFDDILTKDINQDESFERVSIGLCKNALNGYNGTLISYGQTNSGKTYSIIGPENGDGNNSKTIGFVSRAASFFFSAIEQSNDINEAQLRVSFLEIYKEELRDLSPKTREYESLKFRKESNGTTIIDGLNRTQVTSLQQVLNLLKNANKKRTMAATKKNRSSSRSHFIITFYLTIRKTAQAGGYKVTSQVSFCDLAGSETLKTMIQVGHENNPIKKKLNPEIVTLSRVVESIVQRNTNIPFEDSKLTTVLKDSLGGNTKTVLLLNISEHELCVNETIDSCKFAARIKLIRTTIIPNKELTSGQTSALINQLRIENDKLKRGINNNNNITNDNDMDNDIKSDDDFKNEISILKLKNRKLQEECDDWRYKYNKADKLATSVEGNDEKLADLEIDLDDKNKIINNLQNESKNLALFNVLLAEEINKLNENTNEYKADSYNADKLQDIIQNQRDNLEINKLSLIDALKDLEFTNDNAKDIFQSTFDKIDDLNSIVEAQQMKLSKMEDKITKKDDEIESLKTQLNDFKQQFKDLGIKIKNNDSNMEEKYDDDLDNYGENINPENEIKYLNKISSTQQQQWEIEEDKAWKKYLNNKANDLGYKNGKELLKTRRKQAKQDLKDGKIDTKPSDEELLSDIRDEFYLLFDVISGDFRNPNELIDDNIKTISSKNLKNKLIDDPIDWNSNDISQWLKHIQLDKYCSKFIKNDIDGKILLIDIDAGILKRDLKIKGMHVDKIIREIKELRNISPGYLKYLKDEGLDDDKLMIDDVNIDDEFDIGNDDDGYDNKDDDNIFELTEEERKYGSQFWALDELFSILDIKLQGNLDKSTFKHGLHALNVDLRDEEMEFLFDQIVSDNDIKVIEYKQFLEHFQFTDYLPPQTQKYSNAILEAVPRIALNRKSYVTRASMVIKYGIKYNNTKTEINNYLLNKGLNKSEIDAAWKQYRLNPKKIRDIDFKSLIGKKNKIISMNIQDNNVQLFDDFKLFKLLKRSGFKNFNSIEFNDIDYLRAAGNNARVYQIKCWYDNDSEYFNGIQFYYECTNGKQIKGAKNYVKQGKPIEDIFKLNNNEYITSITVFYRHFISGIVIDTNNNSKTFGDCNSDNYYTLFAPNGTSIMCLYGSINRLFETLGCYVVRLNDIKKRKPKKGKSKANLSMNNDEGNGTTF